MTMDPDAQTRMNRQTSGSDARPFVSVVIETITAREHDHDDSRSLADRLTAAIAAVNDQKYPRDRFEVIVVLDVPSWSAAPDIQGRWPFTTVACAGSSNYFAAKNAGAATATGDIVALLDGDCLPAEDWLASLADAFTPGVDVVTGRTRYTGGSRLARTFSVPDFGNVVATETGASGVMLNNVAFRRDIILAHPLDARVRRNGGCYLLFHDLKARGVRIVYEPRAVVAHGLDVAGFGFVRKHFDRGFDGTNVYRLDRQGVLRGSAIYRRFGVFGLVALVARRIVIDWVRLIRYRRQIGISLFAVPYFAIVSTMVRLIELTGGVTAALRPGPEIHNGHPSHT
jgi:glycosyltransferase involved in cell wall biosynthesis